MSAQGSSPRGVETAIYLVGGLGLGLFGAQELVSTAVNIYGTTYRNTRIQDIGSPTWAGWIGGLVVAFLFLGAGLYLLLRGRQGRWRGASAMPAPSSTAP